MSGPFNLYRAAMRPSERQPYSFREQDAASPPPFSGPAALAALVLAALVLSTLAWPADALSMPFFSRQVGRDCSYCHIIPPKLNDTGRTFRANGYRFEGEGEWKGVRDYDVLPASFEVEVEGFYNRTTAGGVTTEESDVKIEEVEVLAGGAIGKKGKVSAMMALAVEETTGGADAVIPKAFIQVNDLAGPRASGILNLRAGKWDLGLPFLDTTTQVISNRYLAETTLGVLGRGVKGLELNGAVTRFGESSDVAHRYAVGVVREDLNDDDRLRGYYAWYSATLNERLSGGVIYRGGRESNGATDVSYNKYGAAVEAEAGPFVATAAYMRTERHGLAGRDDYIAELLVTPWAGVSFAGRFELLREDGKKGVKSQSLMARYHILSNVWAQAEWRGLNDDDNVAGANEDESKARLFVVALF